MREGSSPSFLLKVQKSSNMHVQGFMEGGGGERGPLPPLDILCPPPLEGKTNF